MGSMSRFAVVVLAGMVCAGSAGVAKAEYPEKPVTLIMPYGAGGPPDAYGRLFAKKLQERIGQPVVVENRPGANGTIGATYAAKAAPDGYTILYGSTSCISAAKGYFKSLNYEPTKDLVPVTLLAEAYFVFAVPPGEKNTSLPDYLEKIRNSPEKYPIAGASGTAEVISKMLQNASNDLDYTYVRYSSSANMVTDVLGGRLGGILHPVAGASALLGAGSLHGMAVIAPQRLPAIPEVPTMEEILSTPDLDLGAWTGIFVPAGTPQPVIDTLYGHIVEVLKDPAIVAITELGGVVVNMTQSEAAAFIEKDTQRWPVLLRAAGIEPT